MISTALVVFLLSTTTFFAWTTYRLGKSMLLLEEKVEESLDNLDESYRRISDILKMEVAMNDPQIEFILNEIGKTREVILSVANNITVFANQKDS